MLTRNHSLFMACIYICKKLKSQTVMCACASRYHTFTLRYVTAYSALLLTPLKIKTQNNKKVEVNKDGQIEVKESQDVLNAAVSKALESPGQEATNDSILPIDSLENIEQITQDTSVTTDITASPTDSYPQTECLNEKPSLDNTTGNDSALGDSTTEVSPCAIHVSWNFVPVLFYCVFTKTKSMKFLLKLWLFFRLQPSLYICPLTISCLPSV